MSKLISFPMPSRDDVIVEVEEATAGPVRAARPGEIVERATKTFGQATSGIRSIAGTVIEQIKDLGPEAIEVTFSVKFNAETGVILAKTAGEGSCTIKLSWKPERSATEK